MRVGIKVQKIICDVNLENQTDVMRNNHRLDMQYELYRYRHHLHQQEKKYTPDSDKAHQIRNKKDKVQEFITASRFTRKVNNLESIHAKFTLKMKEKDSITALKQARNSGFISICRSIFRFLFRLPKTKGVKMLSRVKRIHKRYKNVEQAACSKNNLYSFLHNKTLTK